MRREHFAEPRLHRGPLVVDDAVVRRITAPARLGDHVLAENPFVLSTDTKDRGARAFVHRIGLELEPLHTPVLERVRQHQQLRFRVRRGAPPVAAEPRPADLDAPVLAIDVAEARRADRPPTRAIDRGERERASFVSLANRRLEIDTEILGRADRSDRPPPQIGMEPHFAESGEVALEIERLEPYVLALECHGQYVHWRSVSRTGRVTPSAGSA